jgi:hypothetical protein
MSIPTSESPQPARKFRLFSFRTLGWALAGLAALITLLALFYLEEDLRGKHAWESYRRELEAKGVVLDLDKFVPAPVPDDQNFAMTPFLAPMFDLNPKPLKPDQSAWRDTNGYNRVENFATNFNWATPSKSPATVMVFGHLTDFNEMASNLWKKNKLSGTAPTGTAATQAILDNLKQYEPVLDELRTASHRPFSRFNVSYDDEDPAAILLPHLAQIKKFCRLLQVRALAELELGRTDAAFEDFKLMEYLTASISQEPFIISHLVRYAVLNFSDEVVWEGLARNQWSDAQLTEIETGLSKLNLLKDARRSMESERAGFGDKLFDYVRRNKGSVSDFGEFGNGRPTDNPFMFAPEGWLYLEQANYHRAFEEKVLPGFDPPTGRVYPHEIDRNFGKYKHMNAGEFPSPTQFGSGGSFFKHNMLSALLLPALGKIYHKAAITQTAVNETMIACALERFRLSNGKLPTTLDALVPKFIDHVPLDICNGQPLVYRPGKGNQFVLYSVGWNETDDGGTTVTGTGSPPPRHDLDATPDPDQGDWVWPEYPAK